MNHFVQAFREAAPYLHYLRGKTLVLGISSTLLHHDVLPQLAADLNLLAALGVRLVLVHGTDAPLDTMCRQNQHTAQHHANRRVCDATTLRYAKQVCGEVQFNVQAALSLGFAHSPQRIPRLRIASGNFVSAKPLGVLDGVDMQYTGSVRKVDGIAITRALDEGAVILLSPLGASASGQHYLLSMNDVAEAIAVALSAEKLIFLVQEDGILDPQSSLYSELTAAEAQQLLDSQQAQSHQRSLLSTAISALKNGISRVQILSGANSGDLLSELFTKHGAGTSISQTPFIHIRPAQSRDIADLFALIQPLAEQGILLPRSHDYLENHLTSFALLEHDRQIDGCIELKTFTSSPYDAELACLAVSNQARDGGYGELLLAHIVKQAKQMGKKRLFALSTHAADWFIERRFIATDASELPPERHAQYQQQARQSKVFVLPLNT